MLTKEGSFQKNFSSFFEGALPQRPTVDSVDSMSSDRSQDSTLGHHVDQCGQMTVVNVNLVCFENLSQLTDQRLSGGLDTEHSQDLDNVVTGGLGRVDAFDSENLGQRDTICFNDPVLLHYLVGTCFLLVVETGTSVGIGGVGNLGNLFKATKRDLVQDVVSELTQDHGNRVILVILHIKWSNTDHLSVHFISGVNDLDDGAVSVQAEVDLVADVSSELEALIKDGLHGVVVNLESQQPP